jgi:putative transposase
MWHHSPLHQLGEAGAYMVTAGTYRKLRIFDSDERLDMVQAKLSQLAARLGWQLQAWAIMANHYHIVAVPEREGADMVSLVRGLHTETAIAANRLDRAPGRKVWFQYWDTHLTFARSYFARLNYVHNNPVHHQLVPVATAYPWCSAGWFERNAGPAFARMVAGFKYDSVKVPDDF